MFFFSEKQSKRFRQLRNISGFYSGKIPEVSRMILGSSGIFSEEKTGSVPEQLEPLW
jgi:hypothetical protein